MPYRDKEQEREYMKEWKIKNPNKVKEYRHRHYLKHKEKVLEENRIWAEKNPDIIKEIQERYKKKKRQWFNNYKKTLKCEICDEKFYPLLDFHHKNSDEKEFNISSKLKGRSIKRVLDEIKKCQVLCANCHRLTHWENKQIYKEDYLNNPYLQGGN